MLLVMGYEFGLDLRVARRRAALTQVDCAHLLGTDQPRISKFEAGTAMPSVVDLSILYLIFDRSLGRTSENILASLRDELLSRLASIPDCPPAWRDRRARFQTLGDLAEKLAALPEQHD
jgi:transcriptional regulator with XRE-family HTH domain